jgi:colicin import membrane protein
MKNKLLVLGLAAVTLITLGVGCNKQETSAATGSTEVAKKTDPSAANALSASEAQKAADAQKAAEDLKAADAQKLREATAQKQAEADKPDQALNQTAADKLVAGQLPAAQQSQPPAGAAQVQALIERAKSLAGENKWDDVLKILAQLAGEKLSPAQQAAVDGLKSDAQKQAGAAVSNKATADAGNALGGLLQPKK